MIGISLHRAARGVTSTPSPSGSTRSMIAASGGRTAARSSASSAVSAGIASKPASRSTTRSARRICGSSSQRRGRAAHAGDRRGRGQRQLDDERRALAGQRLDAHLAAVGLDEPAHDRQPEAGAVPVERHEDPLLLGGRDARALVDDAHQDPRRRSRRPAPRPDARRRSAARSRSGSRTRAAAGVASARISGRSGAIASRTRVGRRAGVLERGADHLVERDPVGARLGRAGLQAREVEQLVDEPREPRGSRARSCPLSSARSAVVERGRRQRLAGGDDRGQRRAQVVRDRAQHRGLDLVAAPQGAASPRPRA